MKLSGGIKSRVERFLLVAFYEPITVPSIIETLMMIQRISIFEVDVLNLFEDRFDTGYLKIPPTIDLRTYDGIIIHNTVAYNVSNLRSLDAVLQMKLKDYDGLKVILKQDEHFRFREFVDYAKSISVDCIFSVMPEGEVGKTYGVFLPGVRIYPMLTGYVTPRMRSRELNRFERPIDIGYRGSIMPLSFGRLCYQKRKVGDEVLKRLGGRGLKLDISSRWEDRFGGEAWFSFLASCKGVLGVESGTGLFDLDGQLETACNKIEERLGPEDGSDAYDEAYLEALSPFEGKVGYYAISPRHFEAIGAGALQILMPGDYSGRMIAGKHYFELAADYSNLDAAVELLLDPFRRKEIVDAAYHEVFLNKRNWIEGFVEELDAVLLNTLTEKGMVAKPLIVSMRDAMNVVVVQAHHYGLDPRRDTWYSVGAPEGVSVSQIGISDGPSEETSFHTDRGDIVVTVPRRQWDSDAIHDYIKKCASDVAASSVLRELCFIAHARNLSDEHLHRMYGLPLNSDYRDYFRWLLDYLVNTAMALVDAGERIRGAGAIIAINFPALMPAIVLRALLGIPVIYEALEYWPEADPSQPKFAEDFWRQLESRIVPYADHRGTVTPQLAALMRKDFGVDFYAIPNCMPCPEKALSSCSEIIEAPCSESHKVRFLFQGNFAPHRGIELLLKAWQKVDPRAVLLLRGPENPFKNEMIRLAQELGLTDDRVKFLEPVSVELLEQAAGMDGDVGIIPYTPAGSNYANCCPNKLGQYLSAGLPIFANQTSFVAEVIDRAQCGLAVDFSRTANIIDAVKRFCNQDFRRTCSTNSIIFFRGEYNWGVVSKPIYAAIQSATASKLAERLAFYPRKASTRSEHPQGRLYTDLRRAWSAVSEPTRKMLRPVAEKGHRWILRTFGEK